MCGRQEPEARFSQLGKEKNGDYELRNLVNQQQWYAQFHKRRSTGTHAFAPLIAFSKESDIRLFQYSHPRDKERPPIKLRFDEMVQDFHALVDGVDNFLCDLAILLLG
ncbi:MAG: hypothetical protein F6K16_11715 [Symploca sp. SIO2B6]|nr:hypothetical protein [Symploca sp. SIO2B6]